MESNEVAARRGRRARLDGDPGRRWQRIGAIIVVVGVGAIGVACDRTLSIVSKTDITGEVNASQFQGHVTATIDTRSGGRTTCEFVKLPPGFTAGTIGTHT